jgi:hypothetical protein
LINPDVLDSWYGTAAGQDPTTFPGQGWGKKKFFRIYRWNEEGGWQQQLGTANAPRYIQTFIADGNSQYGINYHVSLRTSSEAGAKTCSGTQSVTGTTWTGDGTFNFTSKILSQAIGGGDPLLYDKKAADGSKLDPTADIKLDIDHVLGVSTNANDRDRWTKFGCWIKMNSAMGVKDGELKLFIDDVRYQKIHSIDWVKADGNPDSMSGFNMVTFGGNSNFNSFPDEVQHEECYAYDDIKIMTELPEHLRGD